jgi:hypothetical protein
MEKTDVATSAEGPFGTGAYDDCHDVVIVLPFTQQVRQCAHHVKRQGIERPGAVKQDEADAVFYSAGDMCAHEFFDLNESAQFNDIRLNWQAAACG